MKLSKNSVETIDRLMSTCNIANIEKLVIEDGKIRGIDEKRSILMITDKNVPDLGGLNMGLNRLNVLVGRLNLIKNDDDASIEVVKSSRGNEIQSLTLQSKKTKVEFRCASVEAVKGIPKGINDTPMWGLVVPKQTIAVLNQASGAMGAEYLIIASKNDGVYFEFVDSNNDVFSTKFAEAPVPVGEDCVENETFVFKYLAKSTLQLMKHAATAEEFGISIGGNGIMTIEVNGYEFLNLPCEED